MKTSIRSALSASTALGLASFTITSAFVAGAAAPATLLGFGFLAVYGMLEIAIVSYETPRLFASPAGVTPRAVIATAITPARRHVRVPALIEYPVARHNVLRHAA